MRFRTSAALVLATLALAGCQKRVGEMSYTEMKQTADAIRERCRAQGIKDGSPEWQPCLSQEASREVETRDRMATARENYGRSLLANRSFTCNHSGYSTICN